MNGDDLKTMSNITRGKFGLPRPFAVERELVTIRIHHTERIHKSTISSANGYVNQHTDGIEPFFKITGVDYDKVNEDTTASLIGVDTTDTMLNNSDILSLLSNINERIDGSILVDDVFIVPSIEINRKLVESSQTPKLVIKFSTQRGPMDEFTEQIQQQVNENDRLIKILQNDTRTEKQSGKLTADKIEQKYLDVFVLSTTIRLKNVMDVINDVLGPDKKTVTKASYDTIGIDASQTELVDE